MDAVKSFNAEHLISLRQVRSTTETTRSENAAPFRLPPLTPANTTNVSVPPPPSFNFIMPMLLALGERRGGGGENTLQPAIDQLSSLYDVKPPISKAKMTAITRGAIKAIKFYKHVVQSVEKFIQKCKPEYKVPGLYVIDSIVRQSRHQFGAEKDVFAPRFSKNLTQTFVNLFTCPPEEKSKVVRVLNLWQKNTVFQSEVIQPLFDLADPSNPLHQELAPVITSNGSITTLNKTPPTSTNKSSSKQDTPVWLALAQSQIDAASNAVMQMSGQAGGPLPPAKPVALLVSILGAWAQQLRKVRIKRSILLRLSDAHNTVATNALCVTLGIWPLDLEIKKSGNILNTERRIGEDGRKVLQVPLQASTIYHILQDLHRWELLDTIADDASKRELDRYVIEIKTRRRIRLDFEENDITEDESDTNEGRDVTSDSDDVLQNWHNPN
uniref:CID domain-containing protein n=1 Tax=Timema genevievae TaxID=629358 RepID=A0A7R9PK45_TIMGE|nr:unnamed protein product [Timema genevievae]